MGKEKLWQIERVPLKHTLTFVKQIAGGDLLGNKGSSNQGLCDNLEECVGMGDGKEVQEGGDICVSVADSC